jgi:hypothetical protein
MLALLSRKFFTKLGDEILQIETLLVEAANGGHEDIIRMILNAYRPESRRREINLRFQRIIPLLLIPCLVNGNVALLDYLCDIFTTTFLSSLGAEFAIGGAGRFEMLELLEKRASSPSDVHWSRAFEGACQSETAKVDCAKKIFAKWKEEMEGANQMEPSMRFLKSAVLNASGSGSVELLRYVQSNVLDDHWAQIVHGDSFVTAAIAKGNDDVIEELSKAGAPMPNAPFELAPNKAVVH